MKRPIIFVILITSALQAQDGPQKKDNPFPVRSSLGLRSESGRQLFQKQARMDYAMALELKDRGRLVAALRRFQDFRLLYPSHPQTPLVVGHIADIYDRLSQPDRALAELRSYLSTLNLAGQPDAAAMPLLARQADLEYRLGDWQASVASYERLIELYPSSKDVAVARKRLAEMQPETEPEPREDRPEPTDPLKGKPPENDQSSLDRLGEGLDIEN